MPRSAGGATEQPPEPWRSFLTALDGRIADTVALHCIGGFAITMQYGLSRATSDIDILTAIPTRELATLQDLAGQGSELHRRFRIFSPLRSPPIPKTTCAA
jgi:hypothetical protein